MNRKNVIGVLCVLLSITTLSLVHGCDFMRPEEYEPKEFQAPAIDRSAANTILPLTKTTRDTIFIRSNSAIQLTALASINSYAIGTNATPVVFEELGDTSLIIRLGVIDTNLTISQRIIPNSTNSTISLYFNPSLLNTRAMATMVAQSMRDTATDNQIIQLKFAELVDSLRPLAFDTLIFMRYPDSQKVSYAKISTDQPREIYFYTPLTLPRFANIDLVKSDTTLVSYVSIMLPEAIYIQTEAGPIAWNRYRYHLDAGNYIVRFTLTDDAPVVGGVFQFLIIPL